MTFEPNVNQVVVRQIVTEKTQSGIILPGDSNQENKFGEVIAMSPVFFESGFTFNVSFNVGDQVAFVTYSSPLIDPINPSIKTYILNYNEVKSKIIN